jgi:hypothetical protein
MIRHLPLLLLTLTGGCIVYEDNSTWNGRPGDGDDDWNGGGGGGGGDDTDDTSEPDTDVERVGGLVFTPDHAEPGATLLVTVTTDGTWELDTVTNITFGRDIEVADAHVTPREIVLLVHVDDGAEPGLVDIWVECEGTQLLDVQFTIDEINDTEEPPEDTGTACD